MESPCVFVIAADWQLATRAQAFSLKLDHLLIMTRRSNGYLRLLRRCFRYCVLESVEFWDWQVRFAQFSLICFALYCSGWQDDQTTKDSGLQRTSTRTILHLEASYSSPSAPGYQASVL